VSDRSLLQLVSMAFVFFLTMLSLGTSSVALNDVNSEWDGGVRSEGFRFDSLL
jgi:hypothetical protein